MLRSAPPLFPRLHSKRRCNQKIVSTTNTGMCCCSNEDGGGGDDTLVTNDAPRGKTRLEMHLPVRRYSSAAMYDLVFPYPTCISPSRQTSKLLRRACTQFPDL
eukprot:1484293-Rhodomonas_salina.2